MLKHPLLKNTSNDYSTHFIIKEYKKDSLIFNELEKCTCLALILEGEIQISTLTYNDKEYTITCSDDTWTIKGYVDAQNSFGATLRNNFTVKITFTSSTKYTIDLCSIK